MAMNNVHFYVTQFQEESIKKLAKSKGLTKSDMLRRIIDTYIEDKQNPNEGMGQNGID